MPKQHKHTPRIVRADDTETRAGAVIEGLDERWCVSCLAFLGFAS